jgi:CBS domain-containing protein
MASTIGEVVVRVRPLALDDSLMRAAEAVRTAPGGTAPVQDGGEVVGVVTASSLAAWIDEADALSIHSALVRDVVQPLLTPLPSDAAVRDGLEQLQQLGRTAAPVIDSCGRYLGVAGQGELLSAVMGGLRPPLIGGMATPFGVYLTDGTRRGGVGDLALVSTGVFLGLIQLLGSWFGYRASVTALTLLGRFDAEWGRRLMQDSGPSLPPFPLYALLSLLAFALLFRFSRVTGYHAAEHQVVHAIEQGDDLRPEVVQHKPRVHPRCGTNLMAAFGIYLILEPWGGALAFVAALVCWRFFGALLQQYVTTRPARAPELESGLTAGRQLLERYQLGGGSHATGWRRVWNMGLLQVAFGFAVVWTLLVFSQGLWGAGTLEATWFEFYLQS